VTFARSDEALYHRLLAGELAAFDQLYARYERRLFGFVIGQLGDAAEAEDVFHETFLAMLQARGRGVELRSFKAWLFQVARHLCLNRVRSRVRAERAIAALPAPPDAAPADLDAARLPAAVARLPATLGEVYQLRASGLSYDEMAEILDIPVGTVKSRMHETIVRLREEMTR
jgi:RNA polymerase sigma-70 factor, ECF subfamily